MKHKIGIVGLGRMGSGMARRLNKNGHKVVAYNRSPEKVKKIHKNNPKIETSYSFEELIEKLRGKSGKEKAIVWLMLPAGKPTEENIKSLLKILKKGDIIVNGANAFYKEAQKQAKWCNKKGVHLFDVGVSGGVWGEKKGYTLMVGGPKAQYKYIEPFCKSLAPKGGYGYFGEVGKGHYTKSVHNIIEYVYLEGIAEGAELLDSKNIDKEKAFSVWRPASVISSWLVELAAKAFSRKDFKKIKPEIDSETIDELRKTRNDAKTYAPAFEDSTKVRKMKGKKFNLGRKIIAAIRNEFGGHSVEKK